jgi:hypothetical protein
MTEKKSERKKMVVKSSPATDAAAAAKQVKTKPKPSDVKKPDARVDEQIMGPGKYEVTPDQTFTIPICLKVKDGRWIVMAGPGKDTDSHEVVFRMWKYDEQVDLKKRATTFDAERRVHMIDNDALNRLKVQKFMMSWTFDRENPRLKLHHVQGVLTDEGWEAFTKLQQNIIAYVLGEMNQVYEFNG